MRFVARQHSVRLHSLLRSFPAVLLVGPRQCGKSTLARHTLPNWTRLDLERPADLALLTDDLEGFFDLHRRSVVIDEAQRLPEVFPVLRHMIDRLKSSRGQTWPPARSNSSENSFPTHLGTSSSAGTFVSELITTSITRKGSAGNEIGGLMSSCASSAAGNIHWS